MSRLTYRLLLDDSVPLSPDDAAGVVLLEGCGREARTSYCRVDEWLHELANGLSEFETAMDECWIDFSADREAMRLARTREMVVVEFGGAEWTLPHEELAKAARDAVAELVRAFSGFRPFAEGSPLARLDEWLALQDGPRTP